jgi:hypothetical protein
VVRPNLAFLSQRIVLMRHNGLLPSRKLNMPIGCGISSSGFDQGRRINLDKWYASA